MPRYSWKCDGCGEYTEVQASISERNTSPVGSCRTCEETRWERVMESPMVLRQSYLDGQSRGQGYENMKRAVQLDKERANMRPDDRGAIDKEIGKLRKVTD